MSAGTFPTPPPIRPLAANASNPAMPQHRHFSVPRPASTQPTSASPKVSRLKTLQTYAQQTQDVVTHIFNKENNMRISYI